MVINSETIYTHKACLIYYFILKFEYLVNRTVRGICTPPPITFSHVSFLFLFDKVRWWTVLLEKNFPIFDFSTGKFINFEFYTIICKFFLRNCKGPRALLQAPLGGFTASTTALCNFHSAKVIRILIGLFPSKFWDLSMTLITVLFLVIEVGFL